MTPLERCEQIFKMAEEDNEEVIVIYGSPDKLEENPDAVAIGTQGTGKSIFFAFMALEEKHPEIFSAFLKMKADNIMKKLIQDTEKEVSAALKQYLGDDLCKNLKTKE